MRRTFDPLPADDRIRAEVEIASVRELQGRSRRALTRARSGWRTTKLLPLDPPTLRVLAGHVAALLGTAVAMLASPTQAQLGQALGLAMVMTLGALRVVNVGRPVKVTTLALDAAGSATFLAGTGAPSSSYFFLAVAGAWWAAHLSRPHSGSVWAAVFLVAYVLLVFPGSIHQGTLVNALEDAALVVIIGLLADWFVRVDARAIALSEALAQAPAGAEKLAIQNGLTRALGPVEISPDVLLAASREGLTVIQAELLAYLVLGLTNQEIADATKVGVPTVRYRLTRLYRILGVRGRLAAAARARELGLAAFPEA